jgi:hypothetical protein
MPPKRGATTASSRAKKSRPSTDSAQSEQEPDIPRNKRWAKVSGSANAEGDYQFMVRNPMTAYEFVCLCRPPFPNGDDDDDDDDEDHDEEADGEPGRRASCDGGKTCLCDKPASEHPDHPWVMSKAAKRKFFVQRIHCQLRSPDSFGMDTFNDHEGYGALEVLQNLFLDYEEAAGNYKEQWVICETMAYFLHTSDMDPLSG